MAYDLTDLELFLQVVDRGSITQGAEHTHLSLASASARIAAMEKALGAKLLDRHRRGVVPSPTGWLLVAHARAIVGQLARMRTELARAADGLQSTLVVLANTSATQTLVPTGLADFLATHSDIDIELQERPSHEIVAAVTDGRAELGIIADTVDSGRLECTTLREDRYPRLAEIAVPTVVMVGSADRTTPPSHARRLAAGVPGARLVTVPDAGHLLNWEAPEALVDVIGSFEKGPSLSAGG